MRKLIKAITVILIITYQLSVNVKAESLIDISDLIENAKELDGQEVTVQGEAIGESLERGDYSWININDGTNAIGIWLKKSEADKVSYYGDYKQIGDAIKITGIFYRVCKEHGGEADVHSNSLEIMEEGYQVKEQIKGAKIVSVAILVPMALLLIIFLAKESKTKRL